MSGKKGAVPYKIEIGKTGILQTFYEPREKVQKVKERYDLGELRFYDISFSNGDLESMSLKAGSVEQGNLLLEILGLFPVFSTDKKVI